MDNPRWLRLIIIGLVLAALAVGYFLLSGRLASNSVTKTGSQAIPSPSVLGQNAQNLSTPSPLPATGSAYNRIVNRIQSDNQNVQTLPRTGFPVGLAAVFSISTMLAGWGLRKFPH